MFLNLKFLSSFSGYMSPEYAIKGIVSMKTDVFSFGVLLLEIVSGQKNNSCYHSEHPLNFVGVVSFLVTTWLERKEHIIKFDKSS